MWSELRLPAPPGPTWSAGPSGSGPGVLRYRHSSGAPAQASVNSPSPGSRLCPHAQPSTDPFTAGGGHGEDRPQKMGKRREKQRPPHSPKPAVEDLMGTSPGAHVRQVVRGCVGACREARAPPVPTLPGWAGACTLGALSTDLSARPGVGGLPAAAVPTPSQHWPTPPALHADAGPQGPFPLSHHREPHRDCPERTDLMTISKVSLWREAVHPWG